MTETRKLDCQPPFALLDRGFGGPRWMLFEHPVTTIVATVPEQIATVVVDADRMAREGYHAVGFLSYEAAPGLSPELTTQRGSAGQPEDGLPLAWFGIFENYRETDLEALQYGRDRLEPMHWEPSISDQEYSRSIARIRHWIGRGESYQVNFTYRLRSRFAGDTLALFEQLARAQQGGLGAYIDLGSDTICCASPELFFELRNGRIRCQPMKGTARRGRNRTEDEALRRQLASSPKDRAENLMIVDMIRNDLGRIAQAGSVDCSSLFELLTLPTVHQMISTVEASTDRSLPEILRALFPCASITGAPKVRTMQQIRQLETEARGIYTGTVGYLAPRRGDAIFNVAIRTVHVDRRTATAEYGTGGGITWDSGSDAELQESRAKSSILSGRFEPSGLFETLAWYPPPTDRRNKGRENPDLHKTDLQNRYLQGGYLHLEHHLTRLQSSAHHFGWRCDATACRASLEQAIRESPIHGSPGQSLQPTRVRLELHPDGRLTTSWRPLEVEQRTWTVAWALQPIDSNDLRVHHKTFDRQPYDTARAAVPWADDVLLYNERDEVTESTVANLVVVREGRLLTPHWHAGLLPGTLRQELLERKILEEATVRRTDLTSGEGLFLINSVRGWIPISIDDRSTPSASS